MRPVKRAREFLVKPVVPAELLALVQQKLARAPVPAARRT